jgi:SAM-dependent methyltransferase
MRPCDRLSDRVEDYVRFRPSYPAGVFDALARDAGWQPGQRVADIGSGTGIFAGLLLERGNTVFAVEPNHAMRAAAEKALGAHARFRSVKGEAEATTLAGASVGGVTAAQAFHWFHRPAVRGEFQRILRPGGWLAIIWNNRLTDTTPFLRAYEQALLDWSVDYSLVKESNPAGAGIAEFFAPAPVHTSEFENFQRFDWDGLLGRSMSSSYAPRPGHARHDRLAAELRRIFEEHQRNGEVRFEYRTVVYAGRLGR